MNKDWGTVTPRISFSPNLKDTICKTELYWETIELLPESMQTKIDGLEFNEKNILNKFSFFMLYIFFYSHNF